MSLDDLARYLAPNESAAQFLKRRRREQQPSGFAFIDAAVALRPGTVLEVAGPHGAGKTDVLLHVSSLTAAHDCWVLN